ncbi:MAG: hypothetical protein IH626_08050 [Rhodospirillales bacterium]|nr:hypothetical protein [Rhodospirillales bacterium]
MADMINKTVLSKFSVADFGRAQMLVQIQKFYNKKAAQKTQVITNDYKAQINSVNADGDRWASVRDKIQETRSVIATTLGRAKSILASLDNMIRTVNKCGQNTEGYTNPQMYAASFDASLNGLDSTASRSSTVPNLLGIARQEISFPTGINGAKQTVKSAFLGSDYHIVDSEGKYWDLDRQAKILKRYDDYPDEPTSIVGNIATGLRLDDMVGDAITFTVGPDTATPATFTGTLYRTGMKLLDSWAYEGLATTAGRQKALADLNMAKAAVDLEVRRYQLAYTTADYYEQIASESISTMRKKTNQLTIEQATAIQKEQTALSQEYQMSSNSIVQALALQNQYSKMLSPLISSRFGKSLVNILT